jgi:hypothetical protein
LTICHKYDEGIVEEELYDNRSLILFFDPHFLFLNFIPNVSTLAMK